MAYCRWSDCDVYVYADIGGGWTTHVAGRRRVGGKGPDMDMSSAQRIMETYQARMKWLEEHKEMEDLDLPGAGETFNDPTPGECADRLEALLKIGFDVPPEVIDELREEQKDMDLKTDEFYNMWDNE